MAQIKRKKVSNQATKNVKKDKKAFYKFKRFWMWALYYVSYPFVWLAHDISFKKGNKAQKEERVGE